MEHQHTPDTLAPQLATPADADFALAVKKGYEPQDIGLRGIFVFIGVLVAVMAVVLAFIYAVMMALAEHDRSADAVASPLVVKLPAVYAPLQPSLGFNGDHDNDHDVLDQDDMILMRERTAQALNETGTSPAGRHYMSIDLAMAKVLPLIVSKPIMEPATQPTYPAGSHEGVYGKIPQSIIPANAHVNDIRSLNNAS